MQTPTPISIESIAEGATLLIDKPLTWTSFDVVNKMKGILKKKLGKNFKIGHAGTLDPLATGLLAVCTGKNTKIIQGIQDAQKEYTGTFFIGATRPSYDKESEVNETFAIDHIDDQLIHSVAKNFIGEQLQTPPIFSAIKQGGKPVYLKARKGQEVVMEPRKITIDAFEITKIDMPYIEWRIACSKGTYIRTIAHDFGVKLNSGAYLEKLCRTKIGALDLKDAWNMEDLIAHLRSIAEINEI